MEENKLVGSVILLILVAVIIALFCMHPICTCLAVAWIFKRH